MNVYPNIILPNFANVFRHLSKLAFENAFESVKLIAKLMNARAINCLIETLNGTRAGFELVDYLYELKGKKEKGRISRPRSVFIFKFPTTGLLASNAREFYTLPFCLEEKMIKLSGYIATFEQNVLFFFNL